MKKIGFKVFVAIIIISIFFVLYHLHILAFTENKAYNLLTISKFITKMHMTDSTISDVVIVELDDQTLEKYNNWPLNRKYYADAVDILENEGVKAIGFDIMLSDRGTRENDTILAEHFAGYDNIVLPVRPELKMERSASQNFIQRVNKINKPLPEFAENVSLGHIAFIPDSEGIIRSLPLKFKHRGKVYKALSLVLAETAGYEVKTNNKKSILINFSAEQIIPRISFKNLLSGNYSDVNLKDKIILIGATSTSLNDYYMTSLSRFGPMAGVEIHGQAINNLIKGNYINRLPHFYKLILLMILTIIFAIIFRIVSPARSKYILINGLLGYLIVSFIAFYNFNFFIDFLTPAVIILLLYGMNLLYWYLFS
ncbi:MAG: CHASE2 domain-containing protein [Halanaerobiales bacterium]